MKLQHGHPPAYVDPPVEAEAIDSSLYYKVTASVEGLPDAVTLCQKI